MLTTIREEQLLAKFAGEDVAVPQPCTRTEKFLAKMAGLDVQTPTPITREEQILNKIAEGGGGGDFGTAEVTINNITLPSGPQPIDNLYLCVSGEADNDFPACSTVIPINNEFVGQPITVILYKGCQVVMLGSHIEGIIKNVTGSALLTANGLEITGNCSFDVDYTV